MLYNFIDLERRKILLYTWKMERYSALNSGETFE
jgi:hypothetical protein